MLAAIARTSSSVASGIARPAARAASSYRAEEQDVLLADEWLEVLEAL